MVTREAASADRSQPGYAFEFCGGHLAVDFTNTVGSRGDDAERDEHLNTFGDVVAWAEAAGIVNRPQAGKLRGYAAAHPEAARRDLRRTVDLRESLYRVLAAAAHGGATRPADLAALNRFVAETYSGAALARSDAGFVLEPPVREGLDFVHRAVVRAAVDLLTAPGGRKLGACADAGCAWLFLDATRSGTRRWCDMRVCGNRNKVRRFRASE